MMRSPGRRNSATASNQDGRGRNTMRLNFSNAQPAQIEIGIRRLSEVLCEAIEEMEMRDFALA